MMFMFRRTHGPLLGAIAILLAILIAIGALLLLSPTAAAQSASRSAAIVLLHGSDTVVVERILRQGDTVTASIALVGAPRVTVRSEYSLDQVLTRASFSAFGAGTATDAAPLQTGILDFIGDSVIVRLRGGGQELTHRIGARRDALLLINNDFVVVEQVARRARARGVTTLMQPVFTLAGGATLDASFERFAPDSGRFTIAGNVTVVSLDSADNVTGGHLPGKGMTISVVTGAAAAGISLGRPDYSPPADASYTAEDVVVRTPAGHQLSGTLTLPSSVSAGAKVPAVVTITGSGAQDRDEYLPIGSGVRIFRQVADTLSRRGIAVLRLDDRGVGGSGGDVDGTTADFADDIRAAVAYLRTRPEVDGARIALVGHSEGGAIAPMVAASDARIAAIVMLAGTAYNGRQIIDYQIGNGFAADTTLTAAQRDSATTATIAQFDSTAARGKWMRFMLTYEPLPTARRVRQPTLILQGATDQQVRPEEARLLDREMRAAGNERVTTHIFPDRNHLFLRDPDGHPSRYARLTDGRVDAEVLGTLADWLVATLGVR